MLDNRRSRCWIRIQENFVEKTLEHNGEELRKFYSGLTRPVLVGIEATGSMQLFLELMEESISKWDSVLRVRRALV
jgi:hypothetical protein